MHVSRSIGPAKTLEFNRPSGGTKLPETRLEFRTIASLSLIAIYAVEQYVNELRRIQATLLAAPLAILRTPSRRMKVCTFATLPVIFIGLYTLAYNAYSHESEEYDKRIVGYYTSMLLAGNATPKLP